ncbi:protein translocase subunit SecD [Aeromicrobium chenweiae]|uniref:Protein translocase subunit SecD n=1 Tax=Aeromicrobium chenweiae TaxID=2079793 RepID=A0A2S0WMN4_9ACTN|nr:protein translocase subunit SecD [Aeromicrobium chenweiae]AWB92566.1 protein translocase subunit SecD [Aeromicrobium chenweiae]TGN33554.1 protein translocase subunit SecD [Aeromicrobium chenweiae]
MAASPQRSSSLPRPKRTLTIFLVVLLALYALVALINLGTDKGEDSAWQPRLGLDLEGGTRITLQAKATEGDVTKDKLDQARNIIDQRVNATGVTEAEVTTQGNDQVIIEIPGERKAGIVDEVGKTAQLRFRLLWTGDLPSAAKPLDAKDAAAQQKIIDDIDWTKLSLDQMITAETQGLNTLPKTYQAGIAALQKEAAGFVCNPAGVDVDDIANKPLVTCDTKRGEVQILSPTVIPGSDIKTAEPQYDSQRAEWSVRIDLKGEGKAAFKTVTNALTPAQNRFAIVLDGETITAPASQAPINNGVSSITGGFNADSAKALSNQLKFGALPLTFGVNGSEEIGPSLAGTQLDAGLIAGVVGLLLVIVYCLLYYRGLGLVIIGSLLVASALTYVMVLLLGKGVGFTLTLPGIAGLIVAIGITADSFIVFFERIRDEVRDGKSLRLAVEAGWVRARGTILAADAVSIIAAVTLFIFAIGVVRGFAFALGLTTLIDVFVVFFFTKPLVSLLARTKFFGQGHKLSGLDASHLGISGRKVSEIARTRPSTAGKVSR